MLEKLLFSMSFKFDFLPSGEDFSCSDGDDVQSSQQQAVPEHPAKELEFSESLRAKLDEQSFPTYTQVTLNDGTIIKYIHPEANHKLAGVDANTDLVPGVYEGGRKIWECSYMLLDYLSETHPVFEDRQRVLELGCGGGLPGLYCLKKGAAVTFQDYNSDVLEEVTMVNAHLTCADQTDQLLKCRFYSGDWKYFTELMDKNDLKFDMILSSETIYSCSSYGKLHAAFKACIAKGGVIYVASKTHYFGVGGGVESFKQFVEARGVFNIETVVTVDENLQCSILKLWKKS